MLINDFCICQCSPHCKRDTSILCCHITFLCSCVSVTLFFCTLAFPHIAIAGFCFRTTCAYNTETGAPQGMVLGQLLDLVLRDSEKIAIARRINA